MLTHKKFSCLIRILGQGRHQSCKISTLSKKNSRNFWHLILTLWRSLFQFFCWSYCFISRIIQKQKFSGKIFFQLWLINSGSWSKYGEKILFSFNRFMASFPATTLRLQVWAVDGYKKKNDTRSVCIEPSLGRVCRTIFDWEELWLSKQTTVHWRADIDAAKIPSASCKSIFFCQWATPNADPRLQASFQITKSLTGARPCIHVRPHLTSTDCTTSSSLVSPPDSWTKSHTDVILGDLNTSATFSKFIQSAERNTNFVCERVFKVHSTARFQIPKCLRNSKTNLWHVAGSSGGVKLTVQWLVEIFFDFPVGNFPFGGGFSFVKNKSHQIYAWTFYNMSHMYFSFCGQSLSPNGNLPTGKSESKEFWWSRYLKATFFKLHWWQQLLPLITSIVIAFSGQLISGEFWTKFSFSFQKDEWQKIFSSSRKIRYTPAGYFLGVQMCLPDVALKYSSRKIQFLPKLFRNKKCDDSREINVFKDKIRGLFPLDICFRLISVSTRTLFLVHECIFQSSKSGYFWRSGKCSRGHPKMHKCGTMFFYMIRKIWWNLVLMNFMLRH